MKASKFLLGICTALLISVLSISIMTRAETTPFQPTEGTVSTYQWNFNRFPFIVAVNVYHYDYNDVDDLPGVYVWNPNYSIFEVSFGRFDSFIEEEFDGIFHNQTHSFTFTVSFLIKLSTREYVNEQGEGSGRFAYGYIDPRNLTVGTVIMIDNTPVNTTTKETIEIMETTREAWKLEFNGNFENQTFYYDAITGILLNAKIRFFDTVFGNYSYEQILISTNAWKTGETTESPIIVIGMGLVVAVRIRKLRPRLK